ncbi:hypothetical protein KL86APRO_20339 [uncultured Alphaproteobacteria bacterium]|uniref:Uncharacterized protein n=1 Tax=uncultured Alphaproteobacteria bacterium TaxID=91750 RepID=A0A212KJS5_9PROT|nr:hypothetical protein KL86APRO_20339 [uncultured Alphaproteobacteria bacterium]
MSEAPRRYALADLDAFVRAAGADEDTAAAATRATMHGTRIGIDSHGVRFLPHYVETVARGHCNGRPRIAIARRFGAVGVQRSSHFGSDAAFAAGMRHYVDALRASPARGLPGARPRRPRMAGGGRAPRPRRAARTRDGAGARSPHRPLRPRSAAPARRVISPASVWSVRMRVRAVSQPRKGNSR